MDATELEVKLLNFIKDNSMCDTVDVVHSVNIVNKDHVLNVVNDMINDGLIYKSMPGTTWQYTISKKGKKYLARKEKE